MAFCVMYNVLDKNRPGSLELLFTADSDSIYLSGLEMTICKAMFSDWKLHENNL